MGVAASLEPKVLPGRDVVDVVLVLVLPPTAVGVHVGLGLASPVDHDLQTEQPGNTEGGDQVVSQLLRCRALATSHAGMGQQHDAVRTSSSGRGRAGARGQSETKLSHRMRVALKRTLMWAQFREIMTQKFMR